MEEKIENKKKTIIIAFAILLGFYMLSEFVSMMSSNPAQISYEKKCASCHGLKGEGLKNMIPPLANSDWLKNNQDRLTCIIKNGINEKIMVNGLEYNIEMLGNEKMQDIEVTNIINYINTSWGNTIPTKKNKKVIQELRDCQ